MTMRERIAEGKLFTDYCEELPEDRMLAKKRMKAFNETGPDELAERLELMKDIFGHETHAWIEPPFYFCYGSNIKMGKKVYINFNCNFIDDAEIIIGDKVMFGAGVTLVTVGHPINPEYRHYLMFGSPVRVEKNCWIGASVTICPGVTIGENTVIGAGSVVTKDIPANSVAVGNPCKVLRKIKEHDMKFYFKDRKITQRELEEVEKLS